MISSWDDYPIHQIAEPIRHVGTSDRNFYDRYYFNLHGSSDELFMVMGMGQYPNLAVQDAFACVRARREPPRGARVARARRPHGHRGRPVPGRGARAAASACASSLEPTEHGIAFDLTWEGAIPAFEEPRQFIRRHGRVLFDTLALRADRAAGSGTLEVGGERFAVTPDRWWGTRDRSWGVRPVGEAEPPGIRRRRRSMAGMWNYFPMQFDDHSILYICRSATTASASSRRPCASGTTPRGRRAARPARVRAHASCRGTRMHRAGSTVSLPRGARRRLRRSSARRCCTLHRDRHRLRHGRRLAPRHVPGAARRAGSRVRSTTRSRRSASTAIVDHVGALRVRTAASATASTSTPSSARSAKYGLKDGASGAP